MRTFLSLLAMCLLAGACSLGGSSAQKQLFDLGLPAAPLPASAQAMPTLAIAPASSSSWLDSPGIVYRLAYVDAQQPKRYANSQWVATPAELITRRLRGRLASQANVIGEGDAPGVPVLKVELEEFTQIFDSSSQSRAVVQLRATLIKNGHLSKQRSFFLERQVISPDAVGGAHALASLTDSAVDEVAQWAMASL